MGSLSGEDDVFGIAAVLGDRSMEDRASEAWPRVKGWGAAEGVGRRLSTCCCC